MNNFVVWTIFEVNICSDKESVMKSNMGKYTFEKEQYFHVINSLNAIIEKDEFEWKKKQG